MPRRASLRSASLICSAGKLGNLARGFAQHGLFAQIKDGKKERAHKDETERKKQNDAGQFPEKILKARDRFGEDGVDGAIFQFLREQSRRARDREERNEDTHCAQRHVLQQLKFLLKTQRRQKAGSANEKQSEKEDEVEDFLPRQFRQRVAR